MKSEKYQEAESFKKIFKNIFKSDLADLIKSAQKSTEKPIQISELPSHYKCNICDFKSKKQSYLNRHIRLLHTSDTNTPKILVCNTCKFKFARPQLLKNHIKAQHLNEKHFSCSTCDYKSFYNQAVKNHIISQHTGSKVTKINKLDCSECFQQITVCRLCEYTTKKISHFKRHTKLMHGPNAEASNILSCKSCEFETKKTQLLKNHINAHHLNEKRFSCNSCDFQSFYSQAVKNHIISKHKGSKLAKITKIGCPDTVFAEGNDIMCSKCSYVTQKRTYLKRHLQLSHCPNSEESKIMTCNICKFEANRAQSMTDHTNSMHLNQKRFNCSECDYKSYFGHHIKIHMARNHSDNNGEIERISCSQCRFNIEHDRCNEDSSESERQNFDCNCCNLKLITSQQVLVSHMKTFHPEEKLFHCNNCSYRCNWIYNLKTHKKTEHKRAEKKDDSLEATFSDIIGLFMKHAETKARDDSS